MDTQEEMDVQEEEEESPEVKRDGIHRTFRSWTVMVLLFSCMILMFGVAQCAFGALRAAGQDSANIPTGMGTCLIRNVSLFGMTWGDEVVHNRYYSVNMYTSAENDKHGNGFTDVVPAYVDVVAIFKLNEADIGQWTGPTVGQSYRCYYVGIALPFSTVQVNDMVGWAQVVTMQMARPQLTKGSTAYWLISTGFFYLFVYLVVVMSGIFMVRLSIYQE